MVFIFHFFLIYFINLLSCQRSCEGEFLLNRLVSTIKLFRRNKKTPILSYCCCSRCLQTIYVAVVICCCCWCYSALIWSWCFGAWIRLILLKRLGTPNYSLVYSFQSFCQEKIIKFYFKTQNSERIEQLFPSYRQNPILNGTAPFQKR